jgi:type VI secretion system Hcp family effector
MAEQKWFLKMETQVQGWLKGNCQIKDRIDWLEVHEVTSRVHSPKDTLSGHSRGRRAWDAFEFGIEIDNVGVPQLYQALCTNEKVKMAEFRAYRPNADGKDTCYLTIKLTGGSLSEAKMKLPDVYNAVDSNIQTSMSHPAYIMIGCTFEQIQIDHVVGKTTFIDNWLDHKQA